MGGSGGQGGGGLARPGQCGGAHWRVEVATPLLAMAPSGGGMALNRRSQGKCCRPKSRKESRKEEEKERKVSTNTQNTILSNACHVRSVEGKTSLKAPP